MGGRRRADGVSSSLHLLLHLAVMILVSWHAFAADSLRKGGSIKDGETLVSHGNVFEFGFFSPGDSAGRYIGVWYKSIPGKTVVWVGNRERPQMDSSGVLTIDGDGNLVLLNGRGSPTVLAGSPVAEPTVALLRDNGNLVLAAESNSSRIFWQSFDHPTDTFLTGMRLGLRGQENRLLTSWRNPHDPTPGDFEFGLDPKGTAQFLMWQRGYRFWTSGLWNGEAFALLPHTTLKDRNYSYIYVSNAEETYFSCSVDMDTSVHSRVVMDSNGQIKQLQWSEDAQRWMTLWSYPRAHLCEFPSACGINGVCSNSSAPPCSCLQGFSPGSSLKWDSGEGCERRMPLRCSGDRFLTLPNMKQPVTFLNSRTFDNSSLDAGACSELCAMNCSCTAYASAYKNGTGCFLWFGDLMGLQQGGGEQVLYVRIAAEELDGEIRDSDKKKLLLLLLVPVVLGEITLACCLIKFCVHLRKSQHRGEEQIEEDLLMLEIGGGGSRRYGEFSVLGFDKIAEATDNFSAENKLGEGGFGPVYKGMLSEGQEIAVKRLSRRSWQGMQEFKTEILLIAKLQHRNLVRLLGCCIKREERMLIYEYLPNKSLDFFLFDRVRPIQLDWAKRFHIIEGVAQGLLYLHIHSRLRIIHRDLKASNVLLDSDMNPKISDFGMARIFSSNDSAANTNRVVGTYGYMSPEYAMEGIFSVKSDVFSFGVLLLEIVSGKRNTSAHYFSGSLNLLGHAWKLWNEGRGLELTDPSLGDSCPLAEVSRCIHIGLMCVQEAAEERPTTSDIVAMLDTKNASLPAPKEPAFFTGRKLAKENSYPNQLGNDSSNIVTISVMDGR